MKNFIWISIALLTIQAVRSYILVTANLEDVHTVAKQLATSPVVEQMKRIWRRAASQFHSELNKYKLRHSDDDELTSSEEISRRRQMDTLISLGKNATQYLKAVKRAFDRL